MNFKFVATQFGESIKYDTTTNEVGRVFSALSDIKLGNYPNDSITSSRSQLIYSWIMTIGNSPLSETGKAELVRQAIISLVVNKDVQEKLLSFIDIKPVIKTSAKTYIHEARIIELKSIKSGDFDLSRLIKYCEELNTAFSFGCYLSTAMLVRAIIDHTPPIFSKNTFTEVANNHGSRSFKDSMKNLDNSSRKISDSHLHTQIRKKEVLPNSNQVDFSNDLDVLLAEIYRVLK
jgi:hypothetical protein